MTNNELLLNISGLLDQKMLPINIRLSSIEHRLTLMENHLNSLKNTINNDMDPRLNFVKLNLENMILPRLQNIEECYLTTFKRYQSGVDHFDSMEVDIQIMKNILTEHSEKLQKIS